MTAWVTKYALTSGIKEVECTVTDTDDRMIIVEHGYGYAYYHKPYWHESYGKAADHARVLQAKRLKSLHKTIERIKNLSF